MTERDPAECATATVELQADVLAVHFLRIDGEECPPIRCLNADQAAELVRSMNPTEIYLRVSEGEARAAFALAAAFPDAVVVDDPEQLRTLQ